MKYIFIDTNLFFDIMTSNNGENVLDAILAQLSKNNIKFILPEVIKVEIFTQYNSWKSSVIESIKINLETKKILGIKDALTDTEKKKNKKQKGETEAEKIDSLIEPHRKKIVKKIEEHYQLILKKSDNVFKHKNTKILTLTNQILLAGMKRSLLKKAPYTKSEKQTESAHSKDVDCIAFETLVTFCKKVTNEKKKNVLIMCVSDQDYFSSDGKIHFDLIKDIGIGNKSYQSISVMFNKEFQINIEAQEENKGTKSKTGSLAGSTVSLAEESKTII